MRHTRLDRRIVLGCGLSTLTVRPNTARLVSIDRLSQQIAAAICKESLSRADLGLLRFVNRGDFRDRFPTTRH